MHDLIGRAGSFVGLDFAADTPIPSAARACRRSTSERAVIGTKLLFFELEWAELDDDRVKRSSPTIGWRSRAITCARPAGTGRTC